MRTDLGRSSYRTFFHPHRVDGLFSRSFTAGPGDLVPGHWPSGESEAKLPIAGPVAKRAGEQNYRQQNSTHFRREGFMNLDYAVDRIFLQKVGGGYRFIHRLLLEHFAEMGEAEKV